MTLYNRVREYREFAGLSRAELSERIGITRQSLGLIETNKMVPNTMISLRLARVFEVSVEMLFHEEDEMAHVWSEDNIQSGDRIILANIAGQKVARPATGIYTYRTEPLTAIAMNHPDKKGEIRYIPPKNQPLYESFVIAGCDLGLGLLSEHLQRPSSSSRMNVHWLGVDNSQAFRQLTNAMVHVAAMHFPHNNSPTHNPEVTRVKFSDWEIGWVVKRGNPLNFHGIERFLEGKVRLVNRPVGSGVRDLLDGLIKTAHVTTSQIPQYDWAVAGHRQVAEAVASGAADVGIATASAAAMLHLDFLPIRQESCELWLPKHTLETQGAQSLLNMLNSDVFRWDLERFGPYDVTQTGKIVS